VVPLLKKISGLPIRYKFACCSILTLIVATSFIWFYFSQQQEKHALKMMETKIQEIGVMFVTSIGSGFKFLDFTAINRSVEEIVKNHNLAYIGIFDQEDKMVSFYNPSDLKLDFQSIIHNKNIPLPKEISFFSTEINFENTSYGNLVIGYSLEEMHQQIQSNMLQGLLICFLILPLGTLLIMIQSQALTKNIMMLKGAVKRFN
jgi:hypothetical protein